MSEPRKHFPKVSNCCRADLAVVGSDEGTYYHQCTKCKKACDAMNDEGLLESKKLNKVLCPATEEKTLEYWKKRCLAAEAFISAQKADHELARAAFEAWDDVV